MPSAPSHPSRPDWPLLRDVSRSFYLSVRLLPPGLRQPVALGYLLARASDTVADTPGIPPIERSARLATFATCVHEGTALPEGFTDELAHLLSTPGEAQLLRVLPACLDWAASLPPADLADVRDVLATIVRGQALDVERFGDATPASPRALATVAELVDYTFLVAGCVGEFWTRLAQRHCAGFSLLPFEDMLAMGRAYGQALQLVNILRDRDADLAIGRCYLPAESPDPGPWKARARAGLDDGIRYACSIRPLRLRLASALPALFGIRTLALLETAPGAKMRRAEVRALLVRLALAGCTARALRREYESLSRGAPSAEWENPAP